MKSPSLFVQFCSAQNLFHPESPLGKLPQEAKERFHFQDTVVISEIVLAAAMCCVLFYKESKREFYIFECFPVQVSGNNYFFCKLNVSLQVSKPQVYSFPNLTAGVKFALWNSIH